MKHITDRDLAYKLMDSTGYKKLFSSDVWADAELFSFAPGEYIVNEGLRPGYLYYLCCGRAKLYMTLPNGNVGLIDIILPNSLIGEMELLSEDNEVRAVQATEKCLCLALPLRRYRQQLLNDVCFLRNLCAYLGKKNYRQTLSFIRNQAMPLENRLAGFILMTERDGIYAEKHTEAAEYFGVSYRHLLYVISNMIKNGYLRKEGRVYHVIDRGELLKLADGMGRSLIQAQAF